MSMNPLLVAAGPSFDEVRTLHPGGVVLWRVRRLDVAEAARAGLLIEGLGLVQAASEPLELRLEREHAYAQSVLIARGEQLNLIMDLRAAQACGDEERVAELRQRFEARDREARRGISMLRHDAVPAADVAEKAMRAQQEMLCKVVVGARMEGADEWFPVTLVMDVDQADAERGRQWVGGLSPRTFTALVEAVWTPLQEASAQLGRFPEGSDGAGGSGQAGPPLPGAPPPADPAELEGAGHQHGLREGGEGPAGDNAR